MDGASSSGGDGEILSRRTTWSDNPVAVWSVAGEGNSEGGSWKGARMQART